MNKLYVVQRRSFEYNDETYEMTEGGNVVHAYSTYDAAKNAALEMTVKSLKDGGIEYLMEHYNVFDGDVIDLFESRGIETSEYLSYDEVEEINAAIKAGRYTEDQLKVIAKGITPGNELYYVEEVKVD